MKNVKLFIAIMLAAIGVSAQNSMGIGTNTPSSNAVVEIVSPTGNQGFLIPRYTTAERTAATFTDNLTDADNGLMVFDVTEGILYFWYTGQWVPSANQSLSDVLTVSSDAGASTITNLGDPVDPQDAATKAYVDANAFTSPWTPSASNISYDLGNVGVGTTSPQASLQVGGRLGMFHFAVTSPNAVEGEIVGRNVYYDGTTLRSMANEPVGFMYLAPDGQIQFVHGDTVAAETDLFSIGLGTSLTVKTNRHAEFGGAVEIGQVRDSTDMHSGMLAYNGTSLYLYTGSEWKDIAGGTGGNTVLDGNLDVNGATRTNSAVYSNTVSEAGSRNVQDTDHIIALNGTGNQTIILPDATLHSGRELIFLYTSTTVLNHSIAAPAGNNIFFEGDNANTSITMSNQAGGIMSMTLRAVGTFWFVVNYTISNSP